MVSFLLKERPVVYNSSGITDYANGAGNVPPSWRVLAGLLVPVRVHLLSEFFASPWVAVAPARNETHKSRRRRRRRVFPRPSSSPRAQCHRVQMSENKE